MRPHSRPQKSRTRWSVVRQILLRLVFFSCLWYILAGSDHTSWIIGLPAAGFAAVLSWMLAPSTGYWLSLTGSLPFASFFLRQSFHGALDVMRRALSLRQLLDPGLVSYTTFLPEGTARIMFINTISLLPGTLSAELEGNRVTIHTLDRGLAIWANIQGLEYHIAALMQLPPEDEESI